MADILTELAGQLGSKPALIDDRGEGNVNTWSYADLEAYSNRLAHCLLGLGAQSGMRLLSCGQNSNWLVAFSHAARKIGAVGVPLNYRLTPEEAAYVVDNSDGAFVVVDAEFAELFDKIAPDTPNLRDVLVFDGAPLRNQKALEPLLEGFPDTPPPDIAADANAMTMIYTSGTTGKPKGAVRPSAGDPTQTAALMGMIGYSPDDVYMTTGPLYHSGPSGFLAMAQRLGQTSVLQHKFDPEDWLRLVDTYKVTSTFAAPTPIRRICQLSDEVIGKYDVSSMRIMIANAAPWSMALKHLYLDRFPKESLFEVYGSTELGVNTVLLPDYQLTKPGSCGQPSPGVTIKLFDDNGKEVTTPNTEGELYVASASVFSTYHKAQDKFESDRRGDMQTVGDIAYFDEEGFYYICDRKKDMIISGGVNIYPAEIEDALEKHEDIMDVAVFGIPSEEWGEAIHAIVVVRSGKSLSANVIQDFAREHLANYKVPRSISFMDEIPRTGSGKILKRELRKPFWEGFNARV